HRGLGERQIPHVSGSSAAKSGHSRFATQAIEVRAPTHCSKNPALLANVTRPPNILCTRNCIASRLTTDVLAASNETIAVSCRRRVNCGKSDRKRASASVESARIMHDCHRGVIMPFLTIRHVTTYRYRRPVAFGEHRMMLHPRDSHDQRVIQAGLKISPEPASLHLVQDAFGNYVRIARFSRRSKKLSFESIVCLEHSPYDTALDLKDARRAFPVDYSVDELRELTQYIERHQLDPMNEVDCWARQFLPASGSIGIQQF